MQIKTGRIVLLPVLLLITIFAFLADSNELAARIKKKKSSRKSKISYEQPIQVKKEERVQKLYEYFPLYESWEKAEIFPYNDNEFLYNFDKRSIYESFNKRKLLITRINDWLGVRYRSAGHSRAGVDCSNFTSIIVNEVLGLTITSSVVAQATLFPKIENVENLQCGDLIFFTGRNKKSKRIGHVGIYIGNGLFAHSSSSKGVIYTHISEGYYTARYRFGCRIEKLDLVSLPHTNYRH